MQYTQAQIDRANAVSLEDFLRTQGETLIKSGREYRWKEHDSLTVRGNKWFRHSQSKGGYPIDFVMEFYGKSFPEAVQLLTGESGEGQSEASTAPPTAFHLPLHNRTADRAIQYLCESRGLNKTLVEAFLLSGDIYEDAKRHNVVFVGRDRSGTPRYAHVRGTADPFRQDITGSDKSYPFRYEGNSNQLFVFEAPIDLLSFICLYPQDWQTRNYLALGGVSGKALDPINVVNYIPTRPLHKAAPAENMGHRGLPLSLPSPIRHPCEPHHRAYCTALAIAVTLPPLSLPSHHPGMKRPSRGIEPPRGSFPSLYRVISRASP